jgi:hypothetical protein
MRLVPLTALACLALSGPARADGPQAFRSVQLVGGGHVVLKPGPAAQTRLLLGDPRYTRILDEGDGRLRIENCRAGCPHGYAAEVEVISPSIAALSVSDSGLLEVRPGFSAPASLALAVSNGGTVDARPLSAGAVSAAVAQGGRILLRAEESLNAVVADGGMVAYWGRPHVHTHIARGGVVGPGRAGDFARQAADVEAPPPPPPPPIPPVPPAPPAPPAPPQPW